MRNKKNSAFTLIESLIAVALFGMMAIYLGQACMNCSLILDTLNKNSEEDALRAYITTKIIAVQSIDELESGIDFPAPDSSQITVIGKAYPSIFLDLFELVYTVKSASLNYQDSLFLIRRNWYEDSNDRDTLLKDRTDYLETSRRQSSMPNSR